MWICKCNTYMFYFDLSYTALSMSFLFFKHKTAYEMRISHWSSFVGSSDLVRGDPHVQEVERFVEALRAAVKQACPADELLDAGLGQFVAHQPRERAADDPRAAREDKEARADFLVVGRHTPTLEDSRLVIRVVAVFGGCVRLAGGWLD